MTRYSVACLKSFLQSTRMRHNNVTVKFDFVDFFTKEKMQISNAAHKGNVVVNYIHMYVHTSCSYIYMYTNIMATEANSINFIAFNLTLTIKTKHIRYTVCAIITKHHGIPSIADLASNCVITILISFHS